MTKGIYNIKDFQSRYSEEKPATEEKKPVSEETESAEEKMMKFYEEREKNARETYQNALYKNPPPLSDDEIQRRKRFWRNGNG